MSYFVKNRRTPRPNRFFRLLHTTATLSATQGLSPRSPFFPVATPFLPPPQRSFHPPCRRSPTFRRHNLAAVPPSTVHLYPPQETVFPRPRPSNSTPLSTAFIPSSTIRSAHKSPVCPPRPLPAVVVFSFAANLLSSEANRSPILSPHRRPTAKLLPADFPGNL